MENIKRILAIFILTLFLATSVSPLVREDRAGKRTLKGYDLAGPFTLPAKSRYSGEAEKATAQVREFIWSHWQQRRKGYVSIKRFSIEGAKTTREFFVEPVKGDSWHIRVLITRDVLSYSGRRQKISRRTFTGVALERIESGEGRVISNNVVVGAESYKLVIVSADGERLEE